MVLGPRVIYLNDKAPPRGVNLENPAERGKKEVKMRVSGVVIALFLAVFITSAGKVEAKPPWAETTGSYQAVCTIEYCYHYYPDSDCYCYRYSLWISQGFDEEGHAILDPDLAGCDVHQRVIGRKLVITVKCPDENRIGIELSFGRGKKNSLCLLYKGGNVEFTKNGEPYSVCSMTSYGGYESSVAPRAERSNQPTISSLIRQLLTE